MAYRYVDWYGMARARGYEDPVKMAKSLVERHGSVDGACRDLGISSTLMRRVLENETIELKRVCRHCGDEFPYDGRRHNKRVCDDDDCTKAEQIRKAEQKRTLMKNKKNRERSEYKSSTSKAYSKKPCPDCGKRMEKYNRIRCNECWRAIRSGGADMYDVYGECAVIYS